MRSTIARIRAGVTALLIGTVALVGPPSSTAAEPLPDGTSSVTAAASCWEIKQNVPTAASGVYWLVTPTLQAPEQFYCDMTTDGGGWVLIGRGREGWRSEYEGLGTTAEVRGTVTGTSAFRVRQLSSRVIDGLLNGGRVDALSDGIRVRRATNTAGSSWQEARFNIVNRDRWVWTFRAEHRVGGYSFGSSTGSGGQTNNFGLDSSLRRIDTRTTQAQGWTSGWAFGTSVAGTNSTSSYLWSNTTGGGSARPFTQLYIRPQLRRANLNFPAVPASGTPAQQLSPLAQTGAITTTWGVTGLANGRNSELTTEVQAFAQIGSRVFVAGNFQYVQRGQNATGADRVLQPYLAAFDVNTGEWLSDFRPTINDQVKALAALPNGNLAVGGEFSTVNGQPAVGMVALNPTTGATASGWRVTMENRLTTGTVSVRSLSVKDNWLYIGGAFTHLSGGTSTSAIYARSAARVSVTNGAPASNWNPAFDGTVVSIDAGAGGDRLYTAGYFSHSNGSNANRSAAVSTAAGAPLLPTPWQVTYSSADHANYQQAVKEVGDRVWLGGAEHSLFTFNTSTFARLSGNITKAGGDFQAIGVGNGVLYAGCHCDDWNYSEAYTWSNVGTNWTQADKIGFVGAWDTQTGRYLPDFDPILRGRGGYGSWAQFVDSTGKLWIGGDFTSSNRVNGVTQWAGGFVRFAPRDTTAPTAPRNLSAVGDTSTVTLTWTASSGSPARYEVIRGNRVVATTTATTIQLPATADNFGYAVRAIDSTGNRSASTPVVQVQAAAQALVAQHSSWRWWYSADPVGQSWQAPSFDDSSWPQGPAALGFGSTGLGTVMWSGAAADRPLTAYFRHNFTVADPGQWSSLELATVADDGVVVYVNGTEVGRANMPAGAVSPTMFASAAPRTASATPLTVTVPPSLLVAGTNTVSAEVHLNYRSTPDASFDLSLTAP